MNDKSVDVKWFDSKSGISQIYSNGLEFSFVSEDNKQCHPFVYCKDFLQDAVQATLYSRKSSIYGFSYDATVHPPIDLTKTRLLIVDKDNKTFEKRVANSITFVNHFANKLKIKPSVALRTKNEPEKYKNCGVFLIEGSKVWLNAPPLLSMYTLFLRAGINHPSNGDPEKTWADMCNGTLKGWGREDNSQLKGSKNGIENILKLGYRKFFYIDIKKNYPENTDISTMHNSCGIVGFSQEKTTTVVPYWHRKTLREALTKTA